MPTVRRQSAKLVSASWSLRALRSHGSRPLRISSARFLPRSSSPVRGGAAGIHVARVIERLGLAEQLNAKTKFGTGGDITEITLAQGEGTLGLTQISEIVEKPSAEFVGPLPDELQNYTGVAAGIPISAARSEAVTAFIKFLNSPTAIAVMKAKGMEID